MPIRILLVPLDFQAFLVYGPDIISDAPRPLNLKLPTALESCVRVGGIFNYGDS